MSEPVQIAIYAARRRLYMSQRWLVAPCLVAILIAMIDMHSLSELFPTVDGQVDLVRIDAQGVSGRPIQLALSRDSEYLTIQGDDRVRLEIPLAELEGWDGAEVRSYLAQRVQAIEKKAILTGRFDPDSLEVRLAIDEKLSYGAVKGVVQAIAQANITRYGFTVRSKPAKVAARLEAKL